MGSIIRERAGVARGRAVTTQERPNTFVFGTDYTMCSIGKHIDLIGSLPINKEIKDRIFSRNSMKLVNLKLK